MGSRTPTAARSRLSRVSECACAHSPPGHADRQCPFRASVGRVARSLPDSGDPRRPSRGVDHWCGGLHACSKETISDSPSNARLLRAPVTMNMPRSTTSIWMAPRRRARRPGDNFVPHSPTLTCAPLAGLNEIPLISDVCAEPLRRHAMRSNRASVVVSALATTATIPKQDLRLHGKIEMDCQPSRAQELTVPRDWQSARKQRHNPL